MKIYLVMGTHGEYSDRDEWVIKAYREKSKAEKHVLDAQEFSDKNAIDYEAMSKKSDYDISIAEAKSPFDKCFHPGSYPGSSYQCRYFLLETELEE